MKYRSVLTLAVSPLVFGLLAFAATNSGDSELKPSTVIAEVNGKKITFAEFEEKRGDNLFQARDAFYHAERTVLDGYLDDYVLNQEAQKQGLTMDQLLDREVRSKLPKDPSEEALRVYYEGIDTKESFEAVRDKILEHIRQKRFDAGKEAYIQTLKSRANIVVSLPAPRADVKLDNVPVLGARNAPVMFIEFADYECPYCQQVAPSIQRLETEYKGRVAFAFKDNPLPMHPHAEKAAEAALCANEQGKYWEYHDALFATKKLTVPDLKQEARALNLNGDTFDKCLDSGVKAAAVKTTLTESQTFGITGTPSFFINGRFLSGAASYELLRDAIEQELAASGQNQPKQTAQR